MQNVQVGEESFDFTLAISKLPESLLRAELKRRNGNFLRADAGDADANNGSACGSGSRGAYNTPLHVMALFLILVLSTFACSFPVLARRFPRLPIPRRFLFISRHFGTGVLIATAFVHLLPTAFMSLTDPCLPRFWSQSYRAMAGFVAMMSVFAVVLVEMFFAMKGAGHVHGNDYDTLMGDIGRESLDDFRHGTGPGNYLHDENESGNIGLEGLRQHQRASNTGSVDSESPHVIGSHSDKDDEDDDDIDGLDDYADDIPINAGTGNGGQHQPLPQLHLQPPSMQSRHRRVISEANSEIPIENPQRQLLQCLLLEAGILFHSIFIGMALSVATGTSFVVLLVAISFHQTFEGFALGSRIAGLIPGLFSPSSMKPWLMCLAYGTTTPLGQAIGLVLHNLYDPASATGLLMVGITNAISSGLLLFAGLVELLAEDFLSEASYETLQGRRRFEACISVAAGAILMALVGAFA